MVTRIGNQISSTLDPPIMTGFDEASDEFLWPVIITVTSRLLLAKNSLVEQSQYERCVSQEA